MVEDSLIVWEAKNFINLPDALPPQKQLQIEPMSWVETLVAADKSQHETCVIN